MKAYSLIQGHYSQKNNIGVEAVLQNLIVFLYLFYYYYTNQGPVVQN